MVIAKRLRDERRKEKAIVSDNEQREMIRESQLYRRQSCTAQRSDMLHCWKQQRLKWRRIIGKIAELKSARKRKSDQLQRWLFSQFIFQNARGERKDLLSIFRNYYLLHSPKSVLATHYAAMGEQITLFPPSGTGECCEPKFTSICLYTWYATHRNGDVLVG